MTKVQYSHAVKINVEGLVQGVGFRPFIYRLATENALNGYVQNLTGGVEIVLEGKKSSIDSFMGMLRSGGPEAAHIQQIHIVNIPSSGMTGFSISRSKDPDDSVTQVSPDIAVCSDCLQDMKNQPRRLNYPLINCTNCGPRFSIIMDLPYDRANTTMQDFEMCAPCRAEYEDIRDRRFHAQPVACNICGPVYSLNRGRETVSDAGVLLPAAATLLGNGKIIAIKGTGGYHLMCDARNEQAVARLRASKNREGKPFAVLFRDMESVMRFAEVSSQEEESLRSWKRPIVLLTMKKALAPSVTVGLNTIGAFLPYMPFHYLLFEHLKSAALVLTSGNISDEPVITGDEQAAAILGGISDAVISYNRVIHNRTDDSVVKHIAGTERVFRRSRGYAPTPVRLACNAEGILATGAELSNCFCIGKNNQAILSQHIGDLKNAETFEFYTETIRKFEKLFRFKPAMVACDMHPDYFSTKFAAGTGLERVEVQHHHAHIASCMAEHNLDEPVIGVSFDGTGYGEDGHTWGSEFMVADLESYRRFTHFDYIELPGGDLVTGQPWRTAVSFLFRIYGRNLNDLGLPMLNTLNKKKINLILNAIEKRINCPLSSGAGRLFDAVAALLNVCPVSSFHAEAPMRLESMALGGITERYEISFQDVISFAETIEQIVHDIQHEHSPEIIATKFHNTIIYAIFKGVNRMVNETAIKKVVLSGGTFQNKYIMERIVPLLEKRGLEVFSHSEVPCNDGGIALGQLIIASKRRK